MTYVARSLGVMLVCVAVWLLQPRVYAQDTQTPFINIVNVDRTQAPTVQLSVVGSNLGGDLSTLPLKLFEDGKVQTSAADNTVIAGGQMAFVLDPHNIQATGQASQTHYAEVANAVLDLINSKLIARNADLLAVYSLKADGSLQTIQDWTKEPNLIFNSTVQNKAEAVGDSASLTDLLVQVLDKFETQPPSGLARSLLLFSTGTSPFDLATVVAKATEHNVYIDAVEMAGPNPQAGQPNPLQQLAQQTHGKYVFFTAPQQLTPLWTSLAGLRIQRTLAYKASSATPAPLRVELTLPTGATIQANFKPTDWAVDHTAKPAQAVTTTVAAAPAAAPIATAAVPSATVAVALADAAAAPAPATNNAPVVETNRTNSVVIPGIAVAVPRLALQLALPILILLLAYFIYRDLRERKSRAAQDPNLGLQPNSKNSRLYELSDTLSNLKPLAKNRANEADHYALQTEDDEPSLPVAQPLSAPRYTARTVDDDHQNDEATIMPRPAFGDDEATFRLSEQIEQPIVGYFVRVAGNPTLPNELPIYGLNPVHGEARQIHIGRHSKNNTVVINDKSISREHAVIVQKEGRLYLRDNGSTSGTFLNGKRLQPGEELLLRHNDLTSFGEVTYEFHAKGEDEATVSNA